MNKRKRTIEQIIIYQTLHRKINIDQHVLYDYYYYYYYRELDSVLLAKTVNKEYFEQFQTSIEKW
jgi:hypothetical protein